MDLDRLAASLVVIGFQGREIPPSARELIARGVSGAILFKQNLGGPPETAELTRALKACAPGPFLLCVDQEGGRVARLREGYTPLPPMRRLGLQGDEQLAREVGRLLGEECRAVGFDLDFAPVVDVDSNPDNPVIGDRSFGRDPILCGRLGAALALGIQSAGVAACAKHFPGHGDTLQDSHRTLPRLPHPLARLREVELPPFQALARAGVATMMTAHVVFEALDPDLPATLSPKALALLRGEVGFSGVLVSDDLEMAAVADRWPLDEAAARSVEAGCDLLLVCHQPERQALAIDGIRRAAEKSVAARERLAEAARRVTELRERWAAPPAPFDETKLRGERHLALAARLEAPVGPQHDPTERA
ncbi:MAG: beta-N-acetylhexosaminidase [Deltaproteobacteria bacterium]